MTKIAAIYLLIAGITVGLVPRGNLFFKLLYEEEPLKNETYCEEPTDAQENSEDSEGDTVAGIPYREVSGSIVYDVNVPHIVINKVYGSYDKKTVSVSHSFIELYNCTDFDVDISNYYLYYMPSEESGEEENYKELKLEGIIPSHTSYLIRCEKSKSMAESSYVVSDCDLEWAQKIYNKGCTFILTYGQTDIKKDDAIFDNDEKKPLISKYVDMIAVAGDDMSEGQIPIAYETNFSYVQSKNKSVMRKNFIDTDDNRVGYDLVSIDYNFDNAEYIDFIAPKSTKDGSYTETTMPEYKVSFECNGGTLVEDMYFAYGTGIDLGEVFTEKEGYIFEGWYYDEAFKNPYSDSKLPTGDVILYANWEEEKEEEIIEFPRIYISTNNNGLMLEKEQGYIAADFLIKDVDGSKIINSGEIKVRGNSTSDGDKKPYTIKLSEKVNLFDMGEAKKWVLLANRFDPTQMRNYIALTLAEKMEIEYTGKKKFVEVWMDDTYIGSYLFTEAIEVKENRVELDISKGDFLLEYDNIKTEEGVTYVTSGDLRFNIKEPEIPSESQFDYIQSVLDCAVNALESGYYSEVESIIDTQSFAKLYLLNEFIKNADFRNSSVYFYYKDGKLYAGPPWDYDLTCGNTKSAVTNATDTIFQQECNFGKYLFEYEEYKDTVSDLFYEYYDILVEMFEDGEYMDELYSQISPLVERDIKEAGWTLEGCHMMYNRIPNSTYEKNVEFLAGWYQERLIWLKQYFDDYLDKERMENSKPKIIGIDDIHTEDGKLYATVKIENADDVLVEYSWYAYLGNDIWKCIGNWSSKNELEAKVPVYGNFMLFVKARKVNAPEYEITKAVIVEDYHPKIKGICQIPYDGPGGGYLIGFESFDNPNGEYQYEMLILDCTLLAEGKPAWIMSSGKMKPGGNCLWTVWQPQYGYFWTLFRIYDKDGNLLDEVCYGFANVC